MLESLYTSAEMKAAELEENGLLTQVAALGFNLIENQPADLGAEHVFVALVFSQRLAQAHFGQTGAIKRCRVEIANALLPGGLDRCSRLFVGNFSEHIAQRGGAET